MVASAPPERLAHFIHRATSTSGSEASTPTCRRQALPVPHSVSALEAVLRQASATHLRMVPHGADVAMQAPVQTLYSEDTMPAARPGGGGVHVVSAFRTAPPPLPSMDEQQPGPTPLGSGHSGAGASPPKVQSYNTIRTESNVLSVNDSLLSESSTLLAGTASALPSDRLSLPPEPSERPTGDALSARQRPTAPSQKQLPLSKSESALRPPPPEPPPSSAPYPPHGVKAVCGRRAQMEDAHSVAVNLFDLPWSSAAEAEEDAEASASGSRTPSLSSPLGGIGRQRGGRWSSVAPAAAQGGSSEGNSGGGGGPLHFFGVYDGHGGIDAAQHCADRLHVHLATALTDAFAASPSPRGSGAAVECALKAAFVATDDEFALQPELASKVGSTAVVALLGRDRIWLANCGDSRVVLSRGGKAVQLTTDLKPDRKDEMERIEKAGGHVYYIEHSHRVMGILAMTRAIGDLSLRPYIIPEPEVSVVERTVDDEFLILASDGLWDVMSNQETIDLASRCLARAKGKGVGHEGAYKIAAAVLTKAAVEQGSKDNTTCVIVDLRS